MPDLYAQYLKWYHDRTGKRRWATFEPTMQIVDVGDYGRFGNDLLFGTASGQNIGKKLGIEVDLLPEVDVDAFLNLDAGGFGVSFDGGPTMTFPLHPPLLVKAGAKVKIEAQGDHWFALQVRQAKMIEMANALDVQEKIREAYLARKWPLDYYIVTECVRCSDGFVIMAESKWSGFEFTFDADVTILNHGDLAKGHVGGMYKYSDFAYEPYIFSGSDASGRFPTPTFRAPIGINRKRWAELLGIRSSGASLSLPMASAGGRSGRHRSTSCTSPRTSACTSRTPRACRVRTRSGRSLLMSSSRPSKALTTFSTLTRILKPRQSLLCSSDSPRPTFPASCNSVIGQRLEQAGMHWIASGADSIIAISCREVSSTREAVCNTPITQTRAS